MNILLTKDIDLTMNEVLEIHNKGGVIKASWMVTLFYPKRAYAIYHDLQRLGYKLRVKTFLGRIRRIIVE